MKIAAAWFLLLISITQWVGGFLWFEVSYLIEISHEMNEAEKAIADKLMEEAGYDGALRIINESEITPRGNFYGDFVFSEETDGAIVYFQIDYPPRTVTYEQFAVEKQPQEPEKNSSEKAALLKNLFKDFVFSYPEWSAVADKTWKVPSTFHVPGFISLSFIPVLSPPPDVA